MFANDEMSSEVLPRSCSGRLGGVDPRGKARTDGQDGQDGHPPDTGRTPAGHTRTDAAGQKSGRPAGQDGLPPDMLPDARRTPAGQDGRVPFLLNF